MVDHVDHRVIDWGLLPERTSLLGMCERVFSVLSDHDCPAARAVIGRLIVTDRAARASPAAILADPWMDIVDVD